MGMGVDAATINQKGVRDRDLTTQGCSSNWQHPAYRQAPHCSGASCCYEVLGHAGCTGWVMDTASSQPAGAVAVGRWVGSNRAWHGNAPRAARGNPVCPHREGSGWTLVPKSTGDCSELHPSTALDFTPCPSPAP